MNVLTITLLIANLVTVAATATVIGKELNKLNKKLDEYDANLFGDREHLDEKLDKIHETVISVEEGNDISSIRRELKEHISKEFLAMAFRDIRIVNLSRKGAK